MQPYAEPSREPDGRPDAARPEPPEPPEPPGVEALAPSSRILLAVAAAVLAVVVAVHMGMVFLHVAPSNAVSEQYAGTIDGYIYPEFEQNWKLFAPNPLQQNIAVHARVELRAPDGDLRRTGWVNLTAEDAVAIRGNPFPSHVHQNELRRAWDFLDSSHDSDDRPTGSRGELSESYVKRIVLLRLEERVDTDRVQRVQIRSATRAVAPPRWSGETVDTGTRYRVLPWWPVVDADVPGGSR